MLEKKTDTNTLLSSSKIKDESARKVPIQLLSGDSKTSDPLEEKIKAISALNDQETLRKRHQQELSEKARNLAPENLAGLL